MNDKTSVTVVGDWSKPAQILIEKVSDAIGGGLKPWQIKRVAKAESDATIIKTETEIRREELLSISGLEHSNIGNRAVERMINNEIRKQMNIEKITRKAIDGLADDAKPEELDQDFVSDFFDKSASTSNEEMQSLWAAILAGEANKPGSYSKKTLDVVKNLDRKDADLFTQFCSCCWMIAKELVAVATNDVVEVQEKSGLTFDGYLHLEALGLISLESSGFTKEFLVSSFPAKLSCHYFGSEVVSKFLNPPCKIQTGKANLTVVGMQLAEICGAKPDEDIQYAAIKSMLNANREIYTPWPREP